ncbi:MAG TPA: hypothetical protein VFP93_02865, partial [Gammaproteobacteria bacterium]|nr:hypothetical protein [Gammaproteobacteria bacterium]
QELEPALIRADKLLENILERQDVIKKIPQSTQSMRHELDTLLSMQGDLENRKKQLLTETQVLFKALHYKNANFTHPRMQELNQVKDVRHTKNFTPLQTMNTKNKSDQKEEKKYVYKSKIAPKNL